MPNTIAKITAYLADGENLNAVFRSASLTADLETNTIRFIGENAIKLPKITFASDTAGIVTRGSALEVKDVTQDWDTYVLSQDIGNSLRQDKMDEDEGGLSIIAFANRYVIDVIVPTVDKYRLTKLALNSNADTTKALAITTANSFSALSDAEDKMLDNEVQFAGSIIYLKSTAYSALKKSADFTRFINTGEWTGAIKNEVKMYNDAKIQPIPAARWPYSDLNFLVVNPTAQFSVVKHNSSTYYEKVPGYTGSQIDYRMYHDCFVIPNRNKGIYAEWEKPATPTATAAAAAFVTSITISASTIVPGATIYYTVDGSTAPTTSSTEYVGSFALTATTTVKFAAIKDGVSSTVLTVVYTKA